MKKYFSVFKISFQQEFVYRMNFVMWRVRNVLQIFLVFFLWDTVFSDPQKVVFGYDRSKILTYVFGLLIVRAFVLSAKAMEVAGEISRGDLSNYLLKPINYFKYWLTRDVSSKALNLSFAFVEVVVLFYVLKPPFFIQSSILLLISFFIALMLAMLIYFLILFLTSSVTFWYPEAGWGTHFLISVIFVEFLSGAIFPLDIFPSAIQNILNLTPFPYLIFFPLQVYLGNITGVLIIKGIITSFIWAILLWFLMNFIWNKGLKAYQSHGR